MLDASKLRCRLRSRQEVSRLEASRLRSRQEAGNLGLRLGGREGWSGRMKPTSVEYQHIGKLRVRFPRDG